MGYISGHRRAIFKFRFIFTYVCYVTLGVHKSHKFELIILYIHNSVRFFGWSMQCPNDIL